MNHSNSSIRFKQKTFIYFIVVIIILVIATPVLADYLGPDRTVTEATSTCKVILYECQYITSKNAWKYHKAGDWSCSNESKPWTAYSSNPSSQGCFDATAGHTYWSKEEVLQEVTITYPPATINNSLQNCNLSNGWCNTTPELTLNGTEPLSGYDILAIEGSLNGQIFACPGGNCNILLNEGNNDFTFWALSSWGDSSEMGTFSSKVDTVPPTLGLDITASTGTNGWYVSQASISATGSDSTSGLLSVLLSVNNGIWESSTILNEGVYDIDVQAEDNAGNKSNTTSTISIDTTTPSIDISLSGSTGKNGWHVSNLEVVASASDLTSGINTFDASIDGSVYADYNSPITFIDGVHTIQFKTIDQAGNETQTPVQEFHIDTIAPVVDIPSSWDVNETIDYKVKDNGSGLASLRVVIEDEDERYAKIAWDEKVSGNEFKDKITWDGKFKDGTVAPAGEYLIWIKASDFAGNESYTLSIVTVPSPFSPFQFISGGTSQTTSTKPPKELFEDGVSPAENSSSQTINFGGSTTQSRDQETTTFSVSASAHSTSATTNSNILWGTTAAMAISAVALYAQKEKEKREEETARKRAEIEARIAAQAAQKKAAEEARKIAQWLEGQAILKAQAEERKTQSANNRTERKETELEKEMKFLSAKPEEWQNGFNAYMSKKAMDAFRAEEKAAYYVAIPQQEKEDTTAQTNWWEKTKSFVKDNIIQPINAYVVQPYINTSVSWVKENVYDPYITPVLEKIKQNSTDNIAWVSANIYQPFIKPEIDKSIEAFSSSVSWANNNIYSPYIKPAVEKTINTIVSGASWVNEKVYQPYIKPELDKATDMAMSSISWVNQNIYQPFIIPVRDSIIDVVSPGISWTIDNIYNPYISPVVNDIDKYIYQPIVNQVHSTWRKYGEWMHGSLDAAGLIPGLGEIADGVNGLIYLGEGRYLEAGISALAMIPILGDLGKAGKWTVKVGTEVLEEAAEKIVKEVTEELAEKVVKESLEEASVKVLKETSEEAVEKVVKETAEEVGEETVEKFVKETNENIIEKNAKKDAANKTTEEIVTNKIKVSSIPIPDAIPVQKIPKSVAKETVETSLDQAGKETTQFIQALNEKLGDEVPSIDKVIALIQKNGDAAVKALNAVEPEVAAKVLRTVDENILDDVVQQGSDAFAAFSSWTEKELKEHGKDLAARASKDAEVLNDVKTLVSKGPIDPKNLTDEQKLLIEKIAANSTFYAEGEKVVIGKWVGLDGGFLERARETSSLHYSPHSDLWELLGKLENQNEVAWLINEQVIQTGIAKGLPFEYTLDGVPSRDVLNEQNAIQLIFSGKTDEEIKRALRLDYIPVRMKELQELQKADYMFVFDEISNSFIISLP